MYILPCRFVLRRLYHRTPSHTLHVSRLENLRDLLSNSNMKFNISAGHFTLVGVRFFTAIWTGRWYITGLWVAEPVKDRCALGHRKTGCQTHLLLYKPAIHRQPYTVPTVNTLNEPYRIELNTESCPSSFNRIKLPVWYNWSIWEYHKMPYSSLKDKLIVCVKSLPKAETHVHGWDVFFGFVLKWICFY